MSYSIFPSELFWICHTKERLWNTAELTMPCHKITLLYHRATNAAAAAAKSLQLCLTLWDPRDGSPPRLPPPWDSPGKNTGMGCHFFLQCIKVKSESEVTRLCPTLSNSTRLQPTRLLHPWDFPGKSTGVGCHTAVSKSGKASCHHGDDILKEGDK